MEMKFNDNQIFNLPCRQSSDLHVNEQYVYTSLQFINLTYKSKG